MALAGPSIASTPPDPLSAHRAFLAGVRDRQRARRAKVDAARGAAGGVAGPSNTGRSPPARATSPSRQSGVLDRPQSTSTTTPTANYVPREEAVRNDYAAWYAVSGEWPSNFVLGAGAGEICEEFPALHRLMALKAAHVAASAHAPLLAPLASASPSAVLGALAPHRFDVILLHDPRAWGGTWADVAALPVRQLSADPSFVFLWVGAADAHGLERGRECLAKWGFRRAEDIVWVKTNRGAVHATEETQEENAGDVAEDAVASASASANPGGASSGLFASQKEHCLMGIRGTVRRSTDVHFVHCNVDTDVIVWEGDADGPRTPPYLYTLIENFCLGARRLELFGDAARARQGWVTAPLIPERAGSPPPSGAGALGLATGLRSALPSLDTLKAPDNAERFDSNTYPLHLPRKKEEGKPVLPFHAEIETLRPKSPQRGRGRKNGGGGGGGPSGPQPGSGPSSPPPGAGGGNTPRFNAGVMRMGALTPAQAMTPGLSPQQQQQHAQAMAMAMGSMGGMHAGMGNPLMGLNPMQMQAQMAMAQGMLNPMQMQMMGMGMSQGMPMFNGHMGMGMQQGMPGMMPMMGGGMAGGMGGMGMGNMGMGMGMAGMGEMAGMMTEGGMMSPQGMHGGGGGGSGAMSPIPGATSPRLAQGHGHGHAHGPSSPDPASAYAGPLNPGDAPDDEWGSPVRQLAAGMGAMAMPYASEGYGYDGAYGNQQYPYYGYGYQQQ